MRICLGNICNFSKGLVTHTYTEMKKIYAEKISLRIKARIFYYFYLVMIRGSLLKDQVKHKPCFNPNHPDFRDAAFSMCLFNFKLQNL